MNRFGRNSKKHLSTSDPRFHRIAPRVLRIKNHSVIKGHRPKDEQNGAFERGFSKVKWPHGKHNAKPSKAMDVQTYPRPEQETFPLLNTMSLGEMQAHIKALRKRVQDQPLREEQIYLLGIYKGVAYEQGIPLRTGADWDRDGELSDNGFDDLFHVEIDE